MIFGNKKDFAIEAMIEPELKKPSAVWGRLSLWVSGVSIGNIDEQHCALYPCYDGLKNAALQLNSLWIGELSELNDTQRWNLFDGPLYGCHIDEEIDFDKYYDKTVNYALIYGKFDFITNWGEMFDYDRRGKAFLINEPNNKLQILTRGIELNTVDSLYCTEFGFRKTVKDFCLWFEKKEKYLSNT